MATYFIAQINIHDWEEYRKYLAGTEGPLKQFNAEVLVVDDQPTLLEGDWNCTRTVVIRFPNAKVAQDWYRSPEYQEIVQHRHRAAQTNAVFTNGIDHSLK
jgi:uncharacterized protein (DUF1330 family)